MTGIQKLKRWFEERWPFSATARMVLEEDIPGGASYFYSFGSSILVVFSLQAVTGLMQLFFYVPSVRDAYNSISYLRMYVPFGWLIHGLHYWGAQVIIVLLLLHMTQVFIWGAYKRPRELTWLAGVTLFLTMMVFSFTGAPLHWDQRGYWAAQVGTSIAGVVPFIGDMQKILLRGGEDMGQATISRFFGLHVAVLPVALVALFGFHYIAMRRMGAAGPWSKERRATSGPFWPDQAFKDGVVGTLIFFGLLTLVVFLPPEYTGQADRLDTSYVPKPEWNFLFLYESLKYFEGKLEPIGAAGVPAVLVGLLVLLPFIDRNEERNPTKRPVAMLGGLFLAGVIVALSIMGYMSPGYGTAATGAVAVTNAPAADKETVTSTGGAQDERAQQGPSQGDTAAIGDAKAGAQLFQQNCSACHGQEGKKGISNPGSSRGHVPTLNPIEKELFNKDAPQFAANVKKFIRNGSTPEGPSPSFSMPSFSAQLSEQQIIDLAAYILSLNGVEAVKAGGEETPPKTQQKEQQHPAQAKPAEDEHKEAADEETHAASASEAPARHTHEGNLPSPASDADPSELGEAAFIVGSAGHGEKLFKQNCASCHSSEGQGGMPNPGSELEEIPSLHPIHQIMFSNDPEEFASNLDRFIQHGSVPEGSPAITMPAFGDKNTLTQPQIASIIAYVMELNGVDRAAIQNPGMRPRMFYLASVGLLVLVVLALGGIWSHRLRQLVDKEE